MRTLVIIPTYNETESIGALVEQVLAVHAQVDVLVVDDGSPDGTADIIKKAMADELRLHLLERSAKEGLGAAYRAGFRWGLARSYDALVELDADFSHPPERLPALLEALETADVSIGSRYVPGGRTVGWSPVRKAISKLGNAYVRLVIGLPVHDATAGYRAFRSDVLRALAVESSESNGYCFQIEMAHRAWQEGFRIVEVPITFTERVAGTSKMHRRIVVEALIRVTGWALTGGRRRVRAHHELSIAAPGGA
jgi:glycosyltransferase involved in cell wall biosynthesis